MPVKITAADHDRLHDQYRDARSLIRNEFGGLDHDGQGFNSHARLTKADPLSRVAMLGTDQNDLLIPLLRQVIARQGKKPLKILDVGCGDGQTLALFADALPDGSSIDCIDPSQPCLNAYTSVVEAHRHLTLGNCQRVPFVPDPKDRYYAPPFGRDYDLILAIHVLNHFDDFNAALGDLCARLAPGGTAVVVFTDETLSFTGMGYRAYLDHIGEQPAAKDHAKLAQQRLAVLAGTIPSINDYWPDIQAQGYAQPSRLYGHSLSDLLALGNVAELSRYSDLTKFELLADLLENAPQAVDLRVEDEPGPRCGMYSVTEPQIMCVLSRQLQT